MVPELQVQLEMMMVLSKAVALPQLLSLFVLAALKKLLWARAVSVAAVSPKKVLMFQLDLK